MSFHQLEADAVLQDAHDNQRIENFLKEFGQLKQKYARAQQQISQLTAEVKKLKELNRTLEEGGKKGQERDHQWQSLSAKEQYPLMRESPLPFSQTHNSYFHVQQTKRKVINGFVAELTSELESSEETLLKERRMHEELRRSLQASHEEVLTLKATNRTLEAEMGAVLSENRQLLIEISELQGRQDALEGEVQRGWAAAGCRRNVMGRRAQEAEEEFMLMDHIYRQIEAELESK